MPRKPVASDAGLAKLATLGDVLDGESIPVYHLAAKQQRFQCLWQSNIRDVTIPSASPITVFL